MRIILTLNLKLSKRLKDGSPAPDTESRHPDVYKQNVAVEGVS